MKKIPLVSNKKEELSGAFAISPKIFQDDRGYFFESWNQNEFNKLIERSVIFVQQNQSLSKHGVLRGMHYQINNSVQEKLVKVSEGLIYDVVVDLRISSNTFGQWAGLKIDNKNNIHIWVPAGFAHGFLTLSKKTTVEYFVTQYWNKNNERSLIWNDNNLNIKWPFHDFNINAPIVSSKDQEALKLEDIIRNKDYFK